MQTTLLSSVETPVPGAPGFSSPRSDPARDPYRGVVIVLMAASLLGAGGAIAGGLLLSNPVLLDTAIVLGLAARILAGVAVAQTVRARPLRNDETASVSLSAEQTETPAQTDVLPEDDKKKGFLLMDFPERIWKWFRDLGATQLIKLGTAAAGGLAISFMLLHDLSAAQPSPLAAGIAAAICLVGVGLAATAASYLAVIEPARFPEATGLCRGARVVAWILLIAAASMGLAWAQQQTILRVLHFAILIVVAATCYGLLRARQPEGEVFESFPLDFGVLAALGEQAEYSSERPGYSGAATRH